MLVPGSHRQDRGGECREPEMDRLMTGKQRDCGRRILKETWNWEVATWWLKGRKLIHIDAYSLS